MTPTGAMKRMGRRASRPAAWRQAGWWRDRMKAMRGYARLLLWLLSMGCRQAKWSVVRIVAAGYVGVVTGTAAFGSVALAARLMQSPHPVQVPVLRVEIQAADWIIWLAAGGSLLLAAICGAAVYHVTYVTRQLVRRLHVHLRRQMLMLAAQPSIDDAKLTVPGEPSSLLNQATNSDAYTVSTAFGLLLGTLLPLLTFFWTATVLFWINTPATLALILLSMLYIGPMMLINRRVAQMGHALEEVRRDTQQTFGATLRFLKETHGAGHMEEYTRSHLLANRRMQLMLSCYDENWLSKVKIRVWNTFFGAVCFLVVIILHSQRTGSVGSGSLLAYLISLRFAWNSIGQVNRGIVSVSRFLPRLRRCNALLKNAPPPEAAPEPCAELTIQLTKPGLPATERQATPRRGEPVVLLTPLPLSRYTMPRLQRLIGADWPSTLLGNLGRFSTAKVLGDNWHADFTPWQRAFLEALAADWGVNAALLMDPLRRVNEPTGATTREREFAFWAAQCLREGPQIVWLDLSSFMALSPAFRQAFLCRLPDNLVMLVGSDTDKALDAARATTIILAADAEALQGIGAIDWLRAHEAAIRELVQRRDAAGQVIETEELEEEEEDVDIL